MIIKEKINIRFKYFNYFIEWFVHIKYKKMEDNIAGSKSLAMS